MKKILLNLFVCLAMGVSAQNVGVGTNNPDPSAKLDVQAINGGILIPRIDIQSVSDAVTIPTPATGLMIWNTGATYGTAGFYFNAGTGAAPNWVRVLDTTSSIDDADADPTNEHNTDLTLTGTTLNVIDGGGTESQDLSSLQDHDWYESTGTDQADAIGDNIYTNGSVAIGTTNYNEKLTVSPDANESAEIGRVHLGYMGHNDWAGFSHLDINSTGGYALLQNTDGRTLLNSATGQKIQFRNNNTDQFEMETDGDFAMIGDNSIKMPNNIRWIENTGDASFGNDDNWKSGTYTATMNVESGNVIKLDANALLRLTGGSGNDDFYIRINIDGASGCADLNTEELGWIRASEGGSDHDNFRTYSYMDVINVTCNGTMRFRLQVKNTGDDSWQRRDAILTATKF